MFKLLFICSQRMWQLYFGGFLQHSGEFYKMIDGVTMRPRCWVRYVDDTFVILSHGEKELSRFLVHLNSPGI